ncbi:hypothetical protein POTOM_004100 [Populus tomentosa]|uniref:DYW domain-containing protein n=1 Tax=Populus tomentosa TaxID=118781 RepID=A0A8X8DDF7_POPTO|nr:hypothetical protein POTOM_004100 [Populus tomentosa]
MDGIKPDSLSVSSVLPACARTIARKNGKAIHGHLLGNGIDLNLLVQNATVDMYAKSELVDCALKVFERMKKRDALDGCWIHHRRNIETEAQRPASDVSLHDEDEERGCIQIWHSEMLSLSFALISTQPRATIRFSKVLRVADIMIL